MINVFKNSKTLLTVLSFASVVTTGASAQALTLRVEVENIGPDGGVTLTPVWVGFHDGSFDSYNGGLPSERGLEQIAEDGLADIVSQDFRDNLTYIDNSSGTPVSGVFPSAQVGTRVDGSIGSGPITPGNSAMSMFEVVADDSNRWFSYLSMVLPSSDYYVANGNPVQWDLLPLFTGDETSISFNVGLAGTVNDAGTEVNDFDTSAGNGLFGIPGGQTAAGQGVDEGGVNANVSAPYSNFLNRPADFDTDFANLNFNNEDLYPDGIANITITVVEEPPVGQEPQSVPESSTTVGLMAIAGLFFGAGLRRRNHHIN
ncbi:MAG: spondin domain-containing protein [Crocosphaera sp.]|nr:spondin domain-containing protein [Crocosphaera sp.]